MALASCIQSCILCGLSLFYGILPKRLQTKFRNWRRTADRVLSAFDKGETYRTLAVVTLEVHAMTRTGYLSIEKSAKMHPQIASLWDQHLKFPLNSALRSLKEFSQWLQSQAQGPPFGMTSTDMGQLMRDTTTQQSNARTKFTMHNNASPIHNESPGVPHGIRDLSSEVRLLGDFPVAQGVVSSIWLGKVHTDTRVAVKIFLPPRNFAKEVANQDFLRETHVWSRVHHENVMPLLGIARIRNSVALISSWMPDGDLSTYMKNHLDANRIELLADVARGLAYIHSQGIVYGNLRTSTILVSEMGRAYLSSFLVAHSQEGNSYDATDMLNWFVVSPEFVVPNDLVERKMLTTPESDVFAFATTAIEVLTDRAPYSHYQGVVIRNILDGKAPERPHFLEERGLTDDLWLLLNNCWNREPLHRPTMTEVARRMVQLSEMFTPSCNIVERTASPRPLRDISAEIKRLGEHPFAGGGMCDVYLGERLGSERVALKLVRLFGSTAQDKDAARRRFLSEARMWAEFDHPRILEFYGICEYGTMALFMVSPFLKGGNVMNYLENVDPGADRRRLLTEAAEGLSYLHNLQPQVVHGDLKGANILVTDFGRAVLADFGLSKISQEATTTMLQGAGSPRWMAPELILAGDEITGPLKTQKSDVYAYGHVMLEVLSNKKPFFYLKEDLHVVVELIHGGRSPRPSGPVADTWLDDATWSLSRRCTAIDPEDRPRIEVVISDLHAICEDILSLASTNQHMSLNGHIAS